MARYTCSITVAIHPEDLQPVLLDILAACELELMYNTRDYIMARETPGRVNFSELVTVEVLVDRVMASPEEVRLNFVVKNEALPLQVDNHCRQYFDIIQQLIVETPHWQLLERVGGQ